MKQSQILAGALAMTMLLTSCASNVATAKDAEANSSKSTNTETALTTNEEAEATTTAVTEKLKNKKEKTKKEQTTTATTTTAEEPVKQVTDKPVTYKGVSGKYTGDWKGDRPSGNGELIVSENNYYKGEWYDGMLLGQAEFMELYDDGNWIKYNGKCVDTVPTGKGVLISGNTDSDYYTRIVGDFGNESSLACLTLDYNGKIYDLGGMKNGNYVSYVGNPNVKGIYYAEQTNNRGEDIWPGKYIGQVDKNGIPNGYGYYETYPITYDWVADKSQQTSILGKWKDGHIEGYFTKVYKNSTTTIKSDGCMINGELVGDFVSYTTDDEKLTVYRVNYDTFGKNYELYTDGMYRDSYEVREYYFYDGSYGYNRRRHCYKEGDYFSKFEGEYCNYNKNGKVTDYGIPMESGWQSLKHKDDTVTWETVVTIGATLLAGVAIYKGISWALNELDACDNVLDDSFKNVSPAEQYLNRRKGECNTILNNSRLKEELLEKARREEELGHTYEAQRLRDEANSLSTVIW